MNAYNDSYNSLCIFISGSVFSQVLIIVIILVNYKQHGVLKAFPKITFHRKKKHFLELINACIQVPPLCLKTLRIQHSVLVYSSPVHLLLLW